MSKDIIEEITRTHYVDDSARHAFIDRMERKLEIKQALHNDIHNPRLLSKLVRVRHERILT